jgi:hypothetical protein
VQFSEDIDAVVGTNNVKLIYCGKDQDCTTDSSTTPQDASQYFTNKDASGATNLWSGARGNTNWADGGSGTISGLPTTGFVSFNLASLSNGRYKLELSGGAFKNQKTGTSAPTNEAWSFEFDKGTYTGWYYKYTYGTVDSDSDASGLGFDVKLHSTVLQANHDAGGKLHKYTMCFCDSSKDLSQTTGPGVDASEKYYTPTDNRKVTAPASKYRKAVAWVDTSAEDGMLTTTTAGAALTAPDGKKWHEHKCSTKCAKGCTGPNCFCDGYDSTSTDDYALCLPLAMCQQACDAHHDAIHVSGATTKHAPCYGIDMHTSKPRCYMLREAAAAADLGVNEDYIHFDKRVGRACGDASDYNEYAGTLTVTERAMMGVEYVLQPDKPASLEVVHANEKSLTYKPSGVATDADTGLSKDRITIIDCKGTCGVSSPSSAVERPADAKKIATWNMMWPKHYYNDQPHNDTWNRAQKGPNVATWTEFTYTRHEKHFCQGNINIHDRTISVGGVAKKLSDYQCYHKCTGSASSTSSCDGATSGYYAGFDGATSNALCITLEEAKNLCSRLRSVGVECESFDKHRTRDRVFLNMKGCEANRNYLKASEDYDWYVNAHDVAKNQRRLVDAAEEKPMERRLAHVKTERDWLFSWYELLRYTDIQFNSGGTFKLCFCDSAIAAASSRTCHAESDYSIEIGKIHVSGVSCLLSDTRFQRSTCVHQLYEGLRCYKDAKKVPALHPPQVNDLMIYSPAIQAIVDSPTYKTTCLFGPEEDTTKPDNDLCQIVSAWQSTNPNGQGS